MYKGVHCPSESKRICFNPKQIYEINLSTGAHFTRPRGNVVLSEKEYLMKHMDFLGLENKIAKFRNRRERTKHQWRNNMAIHYKLTDFQLEDIYNNYLNTSVDLRLRFQNDF